MADPLDLARWRALVSDTERVILTACADIIERQGDGAVRYIGVRVDEVREPLTALATALRAACDEVERLRGENSGLQGVLRHLERKAWGGDTTISGFRKWVAERCGAALPPCDLSSQGAP